MRKTPLLLVFLLGMPGFVLADKTTPLLRTQASGEVLYSYGDELPQRQWRPLHNGALRVETKNKGRVLFDLGKGQKWQIFPQSEARVGNWNAELTPPFAALELNRGQMRINNAHQSQKIEVITPISRFAVAPGADVILSWNPEADEALRVEVREGSFEVASAAFEQSFVLARGEQASFIPLWNQSAQGRELIFDLLLNEQRKVRGRWSEKTKLPKDHFAWLAKEEQALKRQAEKERKQQLEKSKPPPGTICQNPWGKLQECLWQCRGQGACNVSNEKARCTRRRCLANGQWGDELELKGRLAFRCEAKLQIGPCDY